ncbi:glycosyltransferase [Aureitalea sp. L0-47]|uniref:glycosyltransferase family 2 protein n=1 Tax=Aureitalea sp. L0-47 TaxID=2816962 RepID=UPI002238AA5E|nr:glycosyltransferase family 2 protein [Aureitalea sp. L0-47]MCW5519188.1 glycosyltransferase [Aureitalea sp. L0-47]
MKSFSIIIPTFNSALTLHEALNSIASQSEKSIEVIVQDGGSNDDTLSVAKNYRERIPGLLIASEKDNGIYDAMNRAMQKATGQWLIFMGSDDKFHGEDVLKKVSEKIKNTKANVVHGDAKIIGDTGWAKDGDIYDGPFDLHKLLNQNICHQAMFYRRSFVIERIGDFNTDYKKSSDWDFNLRCWAEKPFQYIDLVISDFAAGGLSTHSNDKRMVEDFIDNILSYFNVDLFHPLINRPTFIFYPRVVEKQKQKSPLRYKILRIKQKLLKKLSK